jgi:hypothetical protein
MLLILFDLYCVGIAEHVSLFEEQDIDGDVQVPVKGHHALVDII